MTNGKIKICELPEASLTMDNDIFIIENDNTTQKISLGSLINYVKEHQEIANHFVKKSAVDSENGIAPLDSNRKLPYANLPFGTTENTIYDGALGKSLSDSVSSHLADTRNPHTVTKLQVGLSDVDNTADAVKPVSALQQKAIDTAYASSNAYTDVKIAELINGAPSTLDTLGEIAQALQEGNGISDALDAAIGTKASQAELDSHTGNETIHITASERTKWNDKLEKTGDVSDTTATFARSSKLANISTGEKISTIMGKVSKAIDALIKHANTNATDSKYAHVILSDTYDNAISDGAAANGVGASQKAVADAYSALNDKLTDSLGGITFGMDGNGNYGYKIGGADTVTPFKKGLEITEAMNNDTSGYRNNTLYSATVSDGTGYCSISASAIANVSVVIGSHTWTSARVNTGKVAIAKGDRISVTSIANNNSFNVMTSCSVSYTQ